MSEQTIEVGDRVTYRPGPDVADEHWLARQGREYTVVQVWNKGYSGEMEVDQFHLIEVTPPANRHNPIKPDYYFGTNRNTVLVAKATYTPVEETP